MTDMVGQMKLAGIQAGFFGSLLFAYQNSTLS